MKPVQVQTEHLGHRSFPRHQEIEPDLLPGLGDESECYELDCGFAQRHLTSFRMPVTCPIPVLRNAL
jgi:hypothetical protein